MKVNSYPTLSIPRNFTFLDIPAIFIHPNDCDEFCQIKVAIARYFSTNG